MTPPLACMYRPSAWYLSNVELFRGLPKAELKKMVSVLTERIYAKGELICLPGNHCSRTYIVQEGNVTLSVLAHGTTTVIDILQPGAAFGNVGFGSMPEGKFSAHASSKSYVCSLPSETFLRILRNNPNMALTALRQMQRKLAQYESRIHSLTTDDAHHKVLTLVHILCQKEEESMLPRVLRKPLKITHALLGDMTGLRRETVTKQLNVLKREFLIARDGRRLYVTARGVDKLTRAS
jgi:CRP/FNR family cyclic AMP-dependent transcriptional regulator